MRDLLKGVGLSLVLRALSAGLAFLLTVAIGRLLGAADAGLYFLALSVISITSVVARLGFEGTLVRFIATDVDRDEWGHARGVLRHAVYLSGAVSTAFSLAIVATAPLIAHSVFDNPALKPVLVIMGCSVITYNLMVLTGEALKGLSRVRDAMLVNGVLYPLIALCLIIPATGLLGPTGAGLAYLGGTTVAAGIGFALWRRELAGRPEREPVDKKELWASHGPLWVSTVVIRGIQPWAPLLLLGIWTEGRDVGIFGTASRLALVMSFFLIAINTVIAPRFAALHRQRDVISIERLARQFAILVSIAASPVFIVFIFAGDEIMRLFGPGFVSGGSVLAILAVGQAANALTGPVGVVLTMGGRERDMRTLSYASLFILCTMALALIPSMGVMGAAIATTSADILTSFLAVAFVRFRFGIWAIPFFPRRQRS